MPTVRNTVTFTHEDPKIRKQIAEAAVGNRLLATFLKIPKLWEWTAKQVGFETERYWNIVNAHNPDHPTVESWLISHWGCPNEAIYEDGSLSMTGNDVTISFTTEDTPPLQWYAWMQSKHGIACSNVKHEII